MRLTSHIPRTRSPIYLHTLDRTLVRSFARCHWPWVELATVLERAGVVHGQLVALLRLDVAYLGHVQPVHLETVLSIVSSAESHNCHHEEENVTAHRKHGTRAVRRTGDHVHQSTDAREQLSSRGVLHQRATFGSPLVPPSQSDGAVVRTETRPAGPEEDGEPVPPHCAVSLAPRNM